jgi:protease I
MELRGKRIAILIESDYQELEFWYPRYRLQEAGADVRAVGHEAGVTYTSKLGYPAKANLAASDVNGGDFDAVIVPDGMRANPSMLRIIREADAQKRVVAGIRDAGWVLASAGVVKGKNLTCLPNIKEELIKAGATYEDREVVRDGNLITSRMSDDLPAFCREIIEALAGPAKPVEKSVAAPKGQAVENGERPAPVAAAAPERDVTDGAERLRRALESASRSD